MVHQCKEAFLPLLKNVVTLSIEKAMEETKVIPYSGKVWRVESLANLVNCLQFAKLKPSKVVVTINKPLADLFIRQTFFPPKE